MKNIFSKIVLPGAIAVIGVAAGIWIGRVSSPPAAPVTGAEANAAHEHASAEKKAEVWTCSMHPQIRQPGPGKCPICGMDLIPVQDDHGGGDDGPRVLKMSESAMALAEIQTVEVKRAFPTAEVRLVGKLDYDETRVRSLTARFPARIDQLFVNYTGVRVEAGEHLAEVYSPELLTAQRELLTAYRYDPDGVTTRIAREKLRLWDLLPEQIDAIIAAGEARDRFTLRAPMGGIVIERNVQEGDYVKTGQPLFRIADLSEVWLFLDAYEADLHWLRYGQDVAFQVEAFPGETFHGRIAFIAPEVDRRTRTTRVRVNVDNRDGRLKPGMLAHGAVKPLVAAGGTVYAPELAGKWISPMHPEIIKDGPGKCDVCGMDLVPVETLGYASGVDVRAPLLVPASAVLITGKRAVVYVRLPDREEPVFEGREIVLGPRTGDSYVVLDGLEEGDRVVTNGAFKIDSALQIMARPSMMSASDESVAGSPSVRAGAAAEALTAEETSAILPGYLRLQAALSADDFAEAQRAVEAIHRALGHATPLDTILHELASAQDIEGMRRPGFERLSSMIVGAVRAHRQILKEPLVIKHCPMVYPDRGADWLQRGEETRNPYFGAAMLQCGETREILTGEAY